MSCQVTSSGINFREAILVVTGSIMRDKNITSSLNVTCSITTPPIEISSFPFSACCSLINIHAWEARLITSNECLSTQLEQI